MKKKKKQEKNVQTWLSQCKKSFSKEFMIVTEFSQNGKLKVRIEKKVKIKYMYYQEKVLGKIFTEEILFHCPNDF